MSETLVTFLRRNPIWRFYRRATGRCDQLTVVGTGCRCVDDYQTGPSPDYLALLRGEITAEEYVRRLKATVDRRLRG